jgi:Putative DNA-binding domain
MRDLYDQLIADGELAIERLVSERQQENISLEFKTKANPVTGEPAREDRQNLGIALSALSNSMGGVMVWGISAKKDADGVDCATELQPIANIERFKADITRLVSQALMPRHEGILVEAIPAAHSAGAGYLAIYVERSERRPHRCELGVGRYFKRVGDSSIAMEHYDIEDSFKRLVVPWLEVEWLIKPGQTRGGPDGNFRQVAIDIHLRNPSPVTARFPYLILSCVRGANVQPQVKYAFLRFGVELRADRGGYHFAGSADDVIHPELTLPISQLLTPEIRVFPRGGGQCQISRGSVQPVTVAYRCGCYNSRPTAGEFTISDDQLVERGIEGGFIH